MATTDVWTYRDSAWTGTALIGMKVEAIDGEVGKIDEATDANGTGLGLHIVYNLVTQRLGGRISLISGLRKGTEFRMTVPLVAPVSQAQAALKRLES